MIAKSLTEKSWILVSKVSGMEGILINNDNWVYMSKEARYVFRSLDEVKTKLGKITFETVDRHIKTSKLIEINGYTVRHEAVTVVNTDPPLYKAGSTQYNAGYYVVKYSKWSIINCPKSKILSDYDHRGPFKTRLESLTTANMLNKNDE